jgi:hypothetical protein
MTLPELESGFFSPERRKRRGLAIGTMVFGPWGFGGLMLSVVGSLSLAGTAQWIGGTLVFVA